MVGKLFKVCGGLSALQIRSPLGGAADDQVNFGMGRTAQFLQQTEGVNGAAGAGDAHDDSSDNWLAHRFSVARK